MYVKVYISRIEISQKIHFLHHNLLKIMLFGENQKKKTFGRPTKGNNFELKCYNCMKIILRQMSKTCFLSFFFGFRHNLEHFDQKALKKCLVCVCVCVQGCGVCVRGWGVLGCVCVEFKWSFLILSSFHPNRYNIKIAFITGLVQICIWLFLLLVTIFIALLADPVNNWFPNILYGTVREQIFYKIMLTLI